MSTELSTQQSFSLAPQSMEQALQFADQMASCGLIPDHLKKSPANCMRVIMQASEWGMNPFGVADSTSVISGKLMYEGKLTAAVINAKGNLSKRLNYKFSGEGKSRKLLVTGTIRGEDEEREVEVSYEQACQINRNGQMQKNPDQQMCYIGARIWGRRHMPELMLGVYGDDEDVSQEPSSVVEKERPVAPKKKKGAAAAIDEAQVVEAEVVEAEVVEPEVVEPEVVEPEVVEPEPKPLTEKEKLQAHCDELGIAYDSKDTIQSLKNQIEKAKNPEPLKPEPLTELEAGQKVVGNFAIVETKTGKDSKKQPLRILQIKGDTYVGKAFCRDASNPLVRDEGVVYMELAGIKSAKGVLVLVNEVSEPSVEEEVDF